MKLNFCTLFDSNYLSRGLALYESLVEHIAEFHLYIFAFDDKSFEILKKLELSGVTVISLAEFEDEELLNVKKERTRAEYCWTCASASILYAIERYQLSACTYLDSDVFFFNDPTVLFDEMGSDSVLITEHRYSPEYDQSAKSGKYCVQFVTIKNDARGMEVLRWWKAECIKWCFARFEDGKFGDQKYLDEWNTRFRGVHDLRHIGGGVAPWNLQQYDITKTEGKLLIREKITGKKERLIFFHYHYLKFYKDGIVNLAAQYHIPPPYISQVYFPYICKLIRISERMNKLDPTLNSNGVGGPSSFSPYSFRDKVHIFKKVLFSFRLSRILGVREEILSHTYFYTKHIC